MKLQLHQSAIVCAAADLRLLTSEIKAAIKAGEDCTRRGLESFREAGLRLLKVKELLGHGKWLTWVKEALGPMERTAQRCMRLAKYDVTSDLEEEWRRICGNSPSDEDDPEPEGGEDDERPAATTDLGIPDRLKPFFENAALFDQAANRANRAASVFEQIEQTPAYKTAVEGKTHRETSTTLRAVARAVAAMKPARPCPECGGEHEPSQDSDPCHACEGKGYQTVEEAEE